MSLREIASTWDERRKTRFGVHRGASKVSRIGETIASLNC